MESLRNCHHQEKPMETYILYPGKDLETKSKLGETKLRNMNFS